MKKNFLILIILIIFPIGFFLFQNKSVQKPSTKLIPTVTPSIVPVNISENILFVPYWTLSSLDKSYDEYIYFGISPDSSGITKNESGYENITKFLEKVPANSKKLLAVSMTNSTINEKILQDKDIQRKVIKDAINIASQNKFDGIVLDLEYNAFPFDSVIKSVSDFSKNFAINTKNNKLLFYQTVFADTYYRGRPYAVRTLSENADKILVMAYDFHKSNADPGPNFPLFDNEEGYSFTEMIDSFEKDVTSNKLTVVFGMFGYDWQVDSKGMSTGQAISLSDNEIEQKFISKCIFKDCNIKRNSALETKITYQDNNGKNHIVWFEDKNSVSKKEEVLEKSGVSSVGFWANSYF
ncbi:MAG TPA: glycosyl hydrolase family 18 protein [Patescibacteria group bacterium]